MKAQHTLVQHDYTDVQSALSVEKGAVGRANQRISTLQSELQTAQVCTETLQAVYDAKITFLQSALVSEKGKVVTSNQTISTLRSDLQSAQVGAETLVADYNAEVIIF